MMIAWTEEEKAYYAAFLDGEGSVCATHREKGGKICVAFANTNPCVLGQLSQHYGVTLSKIGRGNKKWKPCYHVSLWSNNALDFLQNIRDYATIKKLQVELALEQLCSGSVVNDASFSEIKRLNRKGVNSNGL